MVSFGVCRATRGGYVTAAGHFNLIQTSAPAACTHASSSTHRRGPVAYSAHRRELDRSCPACTTSLTGSPPDHISRVNRCRHAQDAGNSGRPLTRHIQGSSWRRWKKRKSRSGKSKKGKRIPDIKQLPRGPEDASDCAHSLPCLLRGHSLDLPRCELGQFGWAHLGRKSVSCRLSHVV